MLSKEVYAMFMITNLIEPCMGKLIINHLIGNNCPLVRNGLLKLFFQTDFRRWLFGTLFLYSCFQNHESVILQEYQSLLNQSFKHNLVPMPSFNLTLKLSFEPTFRMFIINTTVPWTPCCVNSNNSERL